MPKQPAPKPENLKLTNEEPSLLFAIQELIRTGGIDWDEWWNEWRRGIPNRNQAVTNFRISDWVEPKYLELTQLDSKSGVRYIEYFPDRDNESESYILAGTTRDLIAHIVAIGYQNAASNNTVSGKNSKPPLKGFPLIELSFISEDKKVGKKWLRLAGFTDEAKIAQIKLAKQVTPADIKRWANKIKNIFGDTKYLWKKGKECLSYSGQIARLQGLEGYAYVKNQKDGIELFTAILKIIDTIPDKDGFNLTTSTSPTKYKKEKEIIVAGKSVIPAEKRPIADCYFDSATLRLPLMNKSIPLVKKNVILYK
ncbi:MULTISPECIES: hypothetical protein [unclassified Microcoleus]|uniref:hypothetical protein n=2 Tax=unclassified Microcoleus TaxID=2642155 RepID=UPI001D22185A|nr:MULTISPECIES: hypothetical protein [unclassified Microcoleus]MCC3569524.1 hypothetical protein [Microcoleus sp. PH2017_31_RDM_U_A]MCC3581864.1 hypothetical protein [Microcoleus sp. PH2017_32_RDM_D_A]MCC3595211.1 hypothetical protein [Microcoleus sp. PH2017_28_MFU_U_A]MCC3619794.1 hypothetical protein [Microcoleus sp. PH2017_38_RDM_U_B]